MEEHPVRQVVAKPQVEEQTMKQVVAEPQVEERPVQRRGSRTTSGRATNAKRW